MFICFFFNIAFKNKKRVLVNRKSGPIATTAYSFVFYFAYVTSKFHWDNLTKTKQNRNITYFKLFLLYVNIAYFFCVWLPRLLLIRSKKKKWTSSRRTDCNNYIMCDDARYVFYHFGKFPQKNHNSKVCATFLFFFSAQTVSDVCLSLLFRQKPDNDCLFIIIFVCVKQMTQW